MPSFGPNGKPPGGPSGKPRAIRWKMAYDGLIFNHGGDVDHGDRPAAGRVGENAGGFTAKGPVNPRTGKSSNLCTLGIYTETLHKDTKKERGF